MKLGLLLNKKIDNSLFRDLLVPVTLLTTLVIYSAIFSPRLFTSGGLASALIVTTPLILLTLSITPIALVGRGGVDLAVGPLMGFINVTLVQFLFGYGVDSPILIFAYCILIGVAYQIIQSLIVIFVRVSPIIVSLSSYLILSGFNLVVMPRASGVAPMWMSDWGYGTSVNSPIAYLLLISILLWFLISKTTFYKQIILTGSDERAAFVSGVRVNLARVGAHVLAGIFVGLGAIAFTAMIGSGDPVQGNRYTLQAVTALVLGGTSLAGGRGGGLGSIIGALNMYLIFYVLSSFNFGLISGFVTQMFYGLILVISLLINIFTTSIRLKE